MRSFFLPKSLQNPNIFAKFNVEYNAELYYWIFEA